MKKELFVLIMLIILSCPMLCQVQTVAAETYFVGWSYRKNHVINPASDAGSNYQIRIKVYYGSGTDSGENVFLNGKCRNDFGDIRFANIIPRIDYYRIQVSLDIHEDYGFGYPVTYVFLILQENVSALKAFKRTGANWEQLHEKTSNDLFNGIECVRFDYANRKAYISVAFAEDSEYIDVKITDEDGNVVPFIFDKIAEYYDDRKAVVVATADDLDGSSTNHDAFMSACNAFQSANVWLTVGVITNNNQETNSGPPDWTDIQSQVDEGYIEVASHSRTHLGLLYDDYDSEIGGSKNDIIGNLTLPSPYKKGEKEYVWAWINPYGISDSTVIQKLGQYKYLVGRSTDICDTFVAWDNVNSVYEQHGIVTSPDYISLAELNVEFDRCYNQGRIYHFYFHPRYHNWTSPNSITQHLDYIKGKTDVWYVGFGALYAYHYVQERGSVQVTPIYGKGTFEVLLDYWLEEKVDGEYAVFWVEVADNLSNNPATIYVYYGNPEVTTTSSLENTFIRVIDGVQPLKLSLPMDEGSGTTAYDKSGNNNHGTLYNGASWADGKYLKAVSFDGMNDYVQVSAGFLPTNAITVCLWVKANSYSTSVWRKFINAGPATTAGIYGGQEYLTKDDWGIGLTWDNKNVVDEFDIGALVNVWKFVAIGWDGTDVYEGVNGAWNLLGSGGQNPDWSGKPLYLGSNFGSGENFGGLIDEVHIFNRALTAEEISDLYNYYPFESASLLGQAIIRKRVDPEPSHGTWGNEETSDRVIINQVFVSDERADVGSVQTVGFHAKWNNNGSDVVGGSIYVNGTEYVTNSTGWINVSAAARREEPGNFTIIALPDTQFYSASHPEIFDSQTQWVVNNAQSMNIVFVTHEGDIVDDYSSLSQWNNANNSMSKLDAGNVSYGVLPGNHDGSPLYLSNFNEFFNYSRFNGKSWYGGAYQNENANNFELFHSGQDDYLIFHFQYDPSDQVLAWANSTLQNFPNVRVIVTTHSYLNVDGSRTDIGNRIWQNFVAPHADQVFLVLCGHNHAEIQRTDIVNGHTVYQIIADYQDRTNGGNGWLRILEFHPVEDKIYVRTYSPYLNNYETDADSQFTLDYDMTWIASPIVGKVKWVVTGVNCSGVTTYSQIVQNPSIIWDRIKIGDGGISKGLVMLGEKVTVWFKALYEYDNDTFDGANGVLYSNGFPMLWSTTNNQWQYDYTATTLGTKMFIISGVSDSSYDLTVINDNIGAQTLDIWSLPFSVISNSTISEIAFNSTIRVLSFTVSGPFGTVGYTNVTIAKTLIANISELKVNLDGNQINYTATSTDYSWLIHFTYHHSTHKVLIALGSIQAESSIETSASKTVVICIAMAAILLTALLITKRRKRRA